jgi:MoxR-like ATPase
MPLNQYYVGKPHVSKADGPTDIPSLVRDQDREAAAYIADDGLVYAVNAALILGQPLLLTGEPGTGKTQLAYSVSRELGFGEPLLFDTKSTSIARDLFYTYDTLRRFHDAHLQREKESIEYVTYNALGIAILNTHERSAYADWLPLGFEHTGPLRSVVLIDEIDKAPRDFPNDLLNQIEGMYFRIPELGMVSKRITARDELRPIIFITSNSEKSLPDAFLRRCVYYDIPFPNRARLAEIVLSHLPTRGTVRPEWLADALDLFDKLRRPASALDKKPGTAELLNWITYLRGGGLTEGERLRVQDELLRSSLSTLFKSKSDQERSEQIVKEWRGEPPK